MPCLYLRCGVAVGTSSVEVGSRNRVAWCAEGASDSADGGTQQERHGYRNRGMWLAFLTTPAR